MPGRQEQASVEFLQAALNNDIEKIKSLKHYVNIDVCDNKGLNALIIAVVSS